MSVAPPPDAQFSGPAPTERDPRTEGVPTMEQADIFNQLFPGMGIDPSMVTPEFIEMLTVGLAVWNAQMGLKQIEVQGQQLGLDSMRIEQDKQRLLFEMQELLPFERAKLQFQERMQEFQLQEAQIGLDIAGERSLQAQEVTEQSRQGTLQSEQGTLQAREGTLQAQERTQQSLYSTQQAKLAAESQRYGTALQLSQLTGRNHTGSTASRRFIPNFTGL